MPTNLVCKNIFSTTQDFKGFTKLLKSTLSSKPHKWPVPQGDVSILPLLSNFLPFDNAATCLSSSLFLACNTDKKGFMNYWNVSDSSVMH